MTEHAEREELSRPSIELAAWVLKLRDSSGKSPAEISAEIGLDEQDVSEAGSPKKIVNRAVLQGLATVAGGEVGEWLKYRSRMKRLIDDGDHLRPRAQLAPQWHPWFKELPASQQRVAIPDANVLDSGELYDSEGAFARIDRWLAQSGEPPVLILTGGAGVGKTSLLHRVIAATDELAVQPPDDDPRSVGRGPISVMVDAGGKSPLEVARLIGRAVSDVPINRAAELESVVFFSLRDSARACLLVVDNLDESPDPGALVSQVLIPLVTAPTTAVDIRLLIGTRPLFRGSGSFAKFASRIVIELGAVRYFGFDGQAHSLESGPRVDGSMDAQSFHASTVSDAASPKDQIGFAPHVDALARVVAARSTEPPLAIALLADWGSGKSSFMAQLAGQVGLLGIADRAHFVRKARVVTFNAWHYHGEQSVLVGMMTQVFRALQRPAEGSRERLREPQDGISVGDPQAIENRRVQAKRRSARLKVLRDRVNLSGALGGSAEGRTTRTAVSDILANAWALVYLPWAVVQGRATVVLPAAVGIALALAVVVAQIAAPDVMATVLDRASTWWTAIATSSAGVFASVLWTAIIVARRRVLAGVKSASGAATPVLAFVRSTVVQELKASQAAYEDARAEDALARLGSVLAQAETSLGQHRGVIGVVQDEIEALADAVEAARKHAERLTEEELAEHLPDKEPDLHVDRVILHVDDLDRCPPARVVDVLEAVALLQSTSLFIVVVSVDPRWLRKSLEHHTGVTFPDGEVLTHLNSRVGNPLDYLDKIFQIPFTIPRMQASAGRAFLLEVAMAQKIITEEIRDKDPWDDDGVDSGVLAKSEPSEVPAVDDVLGGTAATVDLASAAAEEIGAPAEQTLAELAKQSRTLDLGAHEVHYLAALTHALPTPRAVKRLLNLYQLLRLGRQREDRLNFAEADGPYKEASLLMALLVGAPDQAAEFFRHLDVASADAELKQVLAVLSGMHADAEHEDRSHDCCQSCERWEDISLVVRAGVLRGAPVNVGPYQAWTREVSRFSFHTTLLRSRPVATG
ncbi:P-loop NTPase fold protein [Promicromonospora sp. NPDC050249]|uniref:P-loop NTPase fold protein n=1 Tax=Promicromonospora sp. NPDC050249 TaxID=3154743 RepID=UPI0033ED643C